MASLRIERRLWSAGHEFVAGTDEAGRGCLAGPVVAAAVILPRGVRIRGVRDSKLIPPDERMRLAKRIRARAVAVEIGTCSPAEIDRLNILWASMEAMRRAIEQLKPLPSYVLVDGNHEIPNATWPMESIIRGDARSQSIAAASIIAKVERDALMHTEHDRYPAYEWITNVGYPTRAHYEALEQHGSTPLHRRSFNLENPYRSYENSFEEGSPAVEHSG